MRSRLTQLLKESVTAVVEMVLPAPCVMCGRTGFAVCPECLLAVERLGPHVCDRCGLPAPIDAVTMLPEPGCPSCDASQPSHVRMRSAGRFDGRLRQGILAFKYRDRPDAARGLASLLVEPAERLIREPSTTVIVPVALHPDRVDLRGYDQAALLAGHLATTLALPYCSAVRRIRATPPQVGLGRRARQTNILGAFLADSDVIGCDVLLVDDVLTTGATVQEAARACITSGARSVCAVTVARDTFS